MSKLFESLRRSRQEGSKPWLNVWERTSSDLDLALGSSKAHKRVGLA
jgi:hypothetical protein